MKHMMMALLIVSWVLEASDPSAISVTLVTRLLVKSNGKTTLNWSEKQLQNDDLPKNFKLFDGKVTHLDLSNNNFQGSFPLAAWLRLFPNLQELTINNNPRITHLALEEDFGNTKLKKLYLRNSGCKELNVRGLYRNFALEVVDVSESQQLEKFIMPSGTVEPLRKEMKLYAHNVGIPARRLAAYQGECFLYSLRAGGIITRWTVFPTACYVFLYLPNITAGIEADYTNVSLSLASIGAVGVIGYKIGEILARACLDDEGEEEAIKITA